ncbi:hypothetical protein ADICYQ_1595 [Cyclobacterium qasimii M12-11B]|uniref:Uncharacterized protein n=1 Tax=Cyclobacterium qasimii M12-11B TaxID=641524 RepID=S7VGK8_9BACT|nr:hypothetical protein ADICYQ_1595 [Cyclobacterium qasimii M12-11B]
MAGAASAIFPVGFAGAEPKSFAQIKRNTEVPVNIKLV